MLTGCRCSTSTPVNPAFSSFSTKSRSASAPDTQPAQAAGWVRTSGGSWSSTIVRSEAQKLPPGRSTLAHSARTRAFRAFVAARQGSQLALERRQPAIEVVDHREQRRERAPPDLWHAVLGQLLERPRLPQRREVAAQAPLGQEPEGAVDRRGPQPNQVRPAAQPLADGPVIERRNPDAGNEIAAGPPGRPPGRA